MYYPLWQVDELEKFLHQMELKGFRLTSVDYSCIYNFAKGKAKDSDYIITYDMAKYRTPCMYEYEHILLSEYSAAHSD